MTAPQQSTPDESFQINRKIHHILLSGCVFMAAIVLFLVYAEFDAPLVDESTALLLTVLGIGLAATAPFVGRMLYQRQVDGVRDDASLSEKLEAFRTASISRWACLEGAVIGTVILYLVSHSMLLLLAALVIFGIFAMTPANRERFAESFRLSMEENDVIQTRP